MYSESFILGYLLSKLGLTFEEAQRITENKLILEKSPQEIREAILSSSNIKIPLLRSLYNIGIDLNELAAFLRTPMFENNDLDNISFWFNQLNFSLKVHVELRRRIVFFLLKKGISINIIAKILNVSPSVVQNDKLIIL